MGFGGVSVGSLLLVLIIVLLLFGTKKLRNIGTDLGGAIRGFKQALDEGQAGNRSEHSDESPESPQITITKRDSAEPPQRSGDARKEHSSS